MGVSGRRRSAVCLLRCLEYCLTIAPDVCSRTAHSMLPAVNRNAEPVQAACTSTCRVRTCPPAPSRARGCCRAGSKQSGRPRGCRGCGLRQQGEGTLRALGSTGGRRTPSLFNCTFVSNCVVSTVCPAAHFSTSPAVLPVMHAACAVFLLFNTADCLAMRPPGLALPCLAGPRATRPHSQDRPLTPNCARRLLSPQVE